MSLDRKIDPITLDYVDSTTKKGAFEEVDAIENQVLVSFMVALAEWEGDPAFGSRFGELARVTNTRENRQRLQDLGKDALAWLIEDGSLESVMCEVDQVFQDGVLKRDAAAFRVNAYEPGRRERKPIPTLLIPVGTG